MDTKAGDSMTSSEIVITIIIRHHRIKPAYVHVWL